MLLYKCLQIAGDLCVFHMLTCLTFLTFFPMISIPIFIFYFCEITFILVHNKLTNSTQKIGIFKWSRDHSTSIKSAEQAGVLHDIKSQ